MGATTPGFVCAHHHLYSTLARGMPSPPKTPHSFLSVLQQVWWRLDAALDLDMIYWSAKLGAAEALMSGTTCIIDHHESPNAIEGSLDVIRQACSEVGVRVNVSYGVTDRWQDDGTLLDRVATSSAMTKGARLGLEENRRALLAGTTAMVGVHAAFTVSDETLHAASDLAREFGVGVHIHVAEGPDDADASLRLKDLAQDNWLIIHGVHLREPLRGVLVHNARSNMNNSVGYAKPQKSSMPVALGTDGIGADMPEEARVAFARLREDELTASADIVGKWFDQSRALFPESRNDSVTWNYDNADSVWHLMYTPGSRPVSVVVDGRTVLEDGVPTLVDIVDVRRQAAHHARRLHERLAA
jgi:cytosine/adenosine deaminase-related metal-dependent hydrolase